LQIIGSSIRISPISEAQDAASASPAASLAALLRCLRVRGRVWMGVRA
jgi:hypothetical protein